MESKATLFEVLLRASRKLELDYEQATMDAPERAAAVRQAAANYLEGYASFNGIDKKAALTSYMGTIRRYVSDIQNFVETGKYPLEINRDQFEISRTDYDLFLILTILVTRHRCAIMEELMSYPPQGKALVIGVGSGVELGFIQTIVGGDAYDLYINPFAREAHPQWQFQETLYRPAGKHYGTIYAIELLEHLSDPYVFVEDCHKSLADSGRFIATTATNVPQFDHRYNFVSDEEFERRMSRLGFEPEYKRTIPHDYAITSIGARNAFYVFKKMN